MGIYYLYYINLKIKAFQEDTLMMTQYNRRNNNRLPRCSESEEPEAVDPIETDAWVLYITGF